MHGKLFKRVFALSLKQSWLAPLEGQLYAMLDECDSDDQVELISELLNEFKFLRQDDERQALESIAGEIINLGYPEETVQVVATSANDDADSGQAVLYGLKPIFARLGWRNVKMVNQFTKAQRNVPEMPNVCLVDEFVGTGRTMLGRIEALNRDFNNNKHFSSGKFHVFTYAGMSQAKDHLLASGLCDRAYFVHDLRRGISDLLNGPDVISKADAMRLLEGKLKSVVNGYPLPEFGDGACEALYGREGGNAPNSVFPIFWWPNLRDGSERDTLLIRKV